jgi:hypothetical protein
MRAIHLSNVAAVDILISPPTDLLPTFVIQFTGGALFGSAFNYEDVFRSSQFTATYISMLVYFSLEFHGRTDGSCEGMAVPMNALIYACYRSVASRKLIMVPDGKINEACEKRQHSHEIRWRYIEA